MYFSPRFVTTAVASLGASPRLGLALRIPVAASASPRVARRSVSNSSDGGGETSHSVVSAAMHFLEDKKRLVDSLSPADYAAVDAVIGGSVGGHMRHTLDHFSKCLLAAQPPCDDEPAPTAPVTIRYDHRVRGGSIETDPAAASRSISSLLQQLHALPRDIGHLRAERVAPTFMLGLGGGDREEHEFESNLERELFFCCHHGTHHDAMIQLILRGMGERGEVALSQAGKGFGVAPSTIDFLKKQREKEEQEKGKE